MLLLHRRIFIVEDNLANRAIMQMALEFEGAKTSVDRWGVDFLKRIQDFAPVDLIILDLMFPHSVTGYDVFDQIRVATQFKDVPIVAVSATDPDIAIPTTRQKGFAGFIRKPIDESHFPKQILALLQGGEIWEEM